MDDPLRNALVVKMGNFFAQDKIFQQRWAAFARAQRFWSSAMRTP
ncbi:Uncharacterised protein [Klebsiella michiganensis]|nr:Uncharacterised protein [Klebsiella michiganensis]